MSAKFMQAYVGNAVDDCEQRLGAVLNHQASFVTALELCAGFRVVGIGLLFMFGDGASLQRYLHKSARAFVHYLQRADDAVKVVSRFKPFFDAIAALDLDAAREIAARSRATRSELEYEEDFLFVRFLMIRFFAHTSDADEQALLARWEEVLEGSEDPRLDVCRGLFQGDGDLFHDGLDRHLAEIEARFQRLAEKEAIPVEELSTEAKLSVEGLALVVLARQVGIKVRKNYLFIPSIALPRAPPTAPPDSWTIVTD